MGLTWGEAEMVALDRIGCGQRLEASCHVPSWEQVEEEDYGIFKILEI